MQSNHRVSITSYSTLTNNGIVAQSSGEIEVESDSTLHGTGTSTIDGGTTPVNGQIIQTGITINGGTLRGFGNIQSDVTNNGGSVGPGNSPGTLTINGNYNQGPSGTLAIEIDSLLAFDVLDIMYNATLGGVLDIQLDAAYAATAATGDMVTIVEWDSFSDAFSSVTGLNFAADRFFMPITAPQA